MPLTSLYNPVETLLKDMDNLPARQEIAREAEEIFKRLESSFAYHSWGKADSKEGRAAAILCYVAQRKGQVIQLHQNLGMKKMTLDQLQSIVSNYLQQQKRKSNTLTAQPITEENPKKKKRGFLSELCIRLDVSIDPNLPRRAIRFLERLQTYFYKLPLHQRKSHLQDLNQHREVYEAAAFLIVCDKIVSVSDLVQAVPDLSHALPQVYDHLKRLEEKIPKENRKQFPASKEQHHMNHPEDEDIEMIKADSTARLEIEKEKDENFRKWREEILLEVQERYETMSDAAEHVLQKHDIL